MICPSKLIIQLTINEIENKIQTIKTSSFEEVFKFSLKIVFKLYYIFKFSLSEKSHNSPLHLLSLAVMVPSLSILVP